MHQEFIYEQREIGKPNILAQILEVSQKKISMGLTNRREMTKDGLL